MNGLAEKIRARRFETGSISFERNKYRFDLDASNYPIGIKVDKRKESSFMVEEYMLLANKFVGKFIVDTCTEIGVLRCHPPPSNKRMDLIQGLLGKMNLKMDFGSSKGIQDSLKLIVENPQVPEAHKTVKNVNEFLFSRF
jgi:exoribonuclease R